MDAIWRDRVEAGQELAKALKKHQDKNTVVYGLPRGGVVTASEVARFLDSELDVLIARKIGHPYHPEYAIGAVTETGEPVLNELETSSLDQSWLEKEISNQRKEAKRRRELYQEGQQRASCEGKIAIIVDDGIATGLTLRAAIKEISREKPQKIIVAAPVAPDDTASEIEAEIDELVCLRREKYFLGSVGAYYEYFDQTEDQEVIDLLAGFRPYV